MGEDPGWSGEIRCVPLADAERGPLWNASVLLRYAPQGEDTVETRLTIDLGVNRTAASSKRGWWLTTSTPSRRTEFAKEAGGYGGMMVGPPARTTWLRISHRIDPDNDDEHEYRAATSGDGENWVWGMDLP